MADDGTQTETAREGDRVGTRIAEDLSTYTTATADFYRGEIDRMTTWRGRLDQTTNWAVVIVAAILTWAFTSPDHPHYVILIGVFGATAFLVMEANRYREYDVWRDRVRALQAGVFADVYAPDGKPGSEWPAERDWQTELGEDLRRPTFDISLAEAINHRLRRSYMALLLILLVAWIARITAFEPSESWRETAALFTIPGEFVVGAVAVFYAVAVALTLWSAREERTEEFQV